MPPISAISYMIPFFRVSIQDARRLSPWLTSTAVSHNTTQALTVKTVASGRLVSYFNKYMQHSHLKLLPPQLRFGSVVSLQNVLPKLLLVFLPLKHHLTRLSWSLIVKFVSFHFQKEWSLRQTTCLDRFKNAFWSIHVRLVSDNFNFHFKSNHISFI